MDPVVPGASILIVEDEPTIAELFKTLMDMEGFRSRVVSNSEEGIEYLRKNVPEAILLDVMLPGTSGLDVARYARTKPALQQTPIIIVSARTQQDDLLAGEAAGADVYLQKPVSNRDLIDTVREQIGSKSSQPVLPQPVESVGAEVDRTAIEVERYLAEINRALDAYETAVGRLKGSNGRSLDETQWQARELAESYRRQIRANQAAGWRVLEDVLSRLELKETAVRRRGSLEPDDPQQWQLASARAQFVREDCRSWARYNPDQIFREFEAALADGDQIYTYLLDRYGQQAFEEEDDWERLTAFQERIRTVDQPDPEAMAELDRHFARLNQLRARLAAVRLPDALLLVQRGTSGPEEADPPSNGRQQVGRRHPNEEGLAGHEA